MPTDDDCQIGTMRDDEDPLEEREAPSPEVYQFPARQRQYSHTRPEIIMLGMEDIYRIIERIRTSSCNVLIVGETGTGKGVLAEEIHRSSSHGKGPFINVHVGGKEEGLFDAELFGHERGAFTGAHRQRAGFFAEAAHGTIFLDEIGELGAKSQVKLLQTLQDRTFYPVGSSSAHTTDARVIGATNVDLKTAVEEGLIRPDLLHRFVVVLKTIPLRERGHKALVALANSFTDSFGKRKKALTLESLAWLCREDHRWPGNIRQLESLISLACLLTDRDAITPDDLAGAYAHSVDSLLNGSTLTADSHAEPSVEYPPEPASNYNPSFSLESLSRMTDEQLLAIINEIGKHGGIRGVLDELYTAVLLRSQELGLSREKVAAAFGVSSRTLYSEAQRALERMRVRS